MPQFKDIFISYGRRESLGFVARLHQKLRLSGYDVWFDKINIPYSENYAECINNGIESAHNFIYIMAARALCSPYCLMELEYARLLGKRVIPINHQVIFKANDVALSASDKKVLIAFYHHHQLDIKNIKTEQAVLERSLGLIGLSDWLDGKELISSDDCNQLATWAQSYENHWYQHEKIDYLKQTTLPQFSQSIDTLDSVVTRLKVVLKRHHAYVEQHSDILNQALTWEKNQQSNHLLLVGKQRKAAEKWLLTRFDSGNQSPITINALLGDFICESRKNAENRMTDTFISYAPQDEVKRKQLIQDLSHLILTTWRYETDIKQGEASVQAFEKGIENADNFLYLISSHSINSSSCQKELEHALHYNKRIVPIFLEPLDKAQLAPAIQAIQQINLYDDDNTTACFDALLFILQQDQDYYYLHKILLYQALKWANEGQKESFLLRGYNLDNAKTWLNINAQRAQHAPLALHQGFIIASEAARGQLGTEVFISYSRKDADFTRRLNRKLQEADKNTWFDQESIATGVDFANEIKKGIASADNFIFVISPDAIKSKYCEQEVNYAVRHGKRIITVLHRYIDSEQLPSGLRHVNWLDFINHHFDSSFSELIQAIEINREYTHQHTITQQHASEWQKYNQSVDFLLNLSACETAEAWLIEAKTKNRMPKPTPRQIDYIDKSRFQLNKLARKERRRTVALSVLLLLAMILFVIAGAEKFKAEKQANLAKVAQRQAQQQRDNSHKNEIWAKSLALTSYASTSLSNKNPNDAAKLARDALMREGAELDPSYAVMAEHTLYESALVLDKLIFLLRDDEMTGINSICYSADKQFLVSGSDDGTIRVWDIAKQQLHQAFKAHSDEIREVVCDNDSNKIASASADKTAQIWDIDTGKRLLLLQHAKQVMSLDFHPDNQKIVTASLDGYVYQWNNQGVLLNKWLAHDVGVIRVHYHPNGQQLFTTSVDKTAKVWNIEEEKTLLSLEHHQDWLLQMRLSPDQQQFATASWDGSVRLWDADTGKVLHNLVDEKSGFNDVVYSPDGRYLVAANNDKSIFIWLLHHNNFLIVLPSHDSTVWSVAFNQDSSQLSSSSADGSIRVWDIEAITNSVLGTHKHEIHALAYDKNKKQLATGSLDGLLRLWDSGTGALKKQWKAPYDIRTLVFSPDGKQLAVSFYNHKQAYFLDSQTLVKQQVLIGHQEAIMALRYRDDGQEIMTASKDHTIRLWDSHTLQQKEVFKGHQDQVWTVVYHPNKQSIISGSRDHSIKIWDIKTAKVQHTFKQHKDAVTSLDIHPNGKQMISSSYDNEIKVWDINNYHLLHTLEGHNHYVHTAIYSPDGKTIVSASEDETILIWNATTHPPQLRFSIEGHDAAVLQVKLIDQGQQIISTSADQTVRRWKFFPTMTALAQYSEKHLWHEQYSHVAQKTWDLKRLLATSTDNESQN